MPVTNSEYFQLLPFVLIGIGIIISVIIEVSTNKSEEILPWFSVLLFLIVGFYSLTTLDRPNNLFGNMISVGGKSAIFNFIFNIGAAVMLLSTVNYLKKYGTYFGEFYILVQSSVLGMMIMAGAKDLIMVFMGLELMSISFYVLAGINRKKLHANEAAMKYFLLGAFATGFIVYGIALIYGMTGTTQLGVIINKFGSLTSNLLFVTGFSLFIVGFSFKIAAFPFHMWVPDVYQGSGSTVTGLMSTTGKTAAFSVLIVVLSAVTLNNAPNVFEPYFAVIATLSMLFGSIVAIAQSNLKRMLAYSSISHAGYMTIALAAGNPDSIASMIFYLAAYTFINLGAFGIISMIEGENDSRLTLDAYAGLSSKSPFLAAMMALFMFALAGIPPMAGFFGKYYVFISAIKSDLTWLAIVGVFSSVISVYFYLRVVVYMYFRDSAEEFVIEKNIPGSLAVLITAILTLLFGVIPDTLLKMIVSVINF